MSAPPSLLLSHGVIESSDSWGAVVPHLSGRFSVLALDARGRGASPAPPRPFGYPELAADVEELAERRGLGHLFHAGHSMGGRVALEHALDHPGRVRAVAAVSARAEAPDEAGRRRLREQAERARRLGPDEAVGMWTQPEDAHYSRVREISARNSAEGTAMALEALASAEPLLPRLPGLRVPALLVVGDGDPSYVRSTRLMAEAIPEADVRILPGVGHFPNLECPELLAELLAEFLLAHSA
ncbi:MAG: alpha/beta hydrolase [bacterium]|nr:alpha/beta hydrolase [bacterium]